MTIFDTDLGEVSTPTAVLDKDVFAENLAAMRAAAGGVPLRVATKSVRVRGLIEWALEQPGVGGLLAYSAAEALWLARCGMRDVLVAYPSTDTATMRAIARDDAVRAEVTLMVDCPEHVDMIARVAREVGAGSLRVALDVDMSLRLGPITIGASRTDIHSVDQAVRLARVVHDTVGVELVGCLFYEAQVAGVPDATPGHRLMKRVSMRDVETRRRAVVSALRELGDLEVVNGGGTGTVHISGRDGVLTDIAVGSGLFAPRLFDGYRALRTKPACYFVTPVVRKPKPEVAVTYSGGYIASGPPTRSRVPVAAHPAGLRYFGQLGAGEVQTPLRGEAARHLSIGDHVWFRHAKAGEMCERFDSITIVEQGRVVETLPTYRGEGRNFG